MNFLKRIVREYIPTNVGAFVKFMMFIQFYYLYQVIATNDVGGISFSVGSVLLVLMSLVSCGVYFQFWQTAFGFSRPWVLFGNFFALLIYDLLVAYQFGSHEGFDWAILADNISSAFSTEAGDVIFNSLDVGALQYLVIISLLFGILEWRKKTISRVIQGGSPLKKSLGIFIIYMGLVLLPFDSYDPTVNLVRSGIRYYAADFETNIILEDGSYPLMRPGSDLLSETQLSAKGRRPNIFLIVVESLNQRAINQHDPVGIPLTPYMNQLHKRSIVVDQFYGNSVQTSKGHFGLLFSMIPSIKGKASVRFHDLKIKSIGSLLKKSGYETVLFRAHHNKDFDDYDQFYLPEKGFDRFLVVRDYLQPEDMPGRLKWGVEDKVYYKRFFDFYDQDKQVQNGIPQLFILATSANHFPFNSMSEERRLIYKDPNSINDHYANSVKLCDEGLQAFFEELDKRGLAENSIVIVTGDHGFPLGEHGNYHLEAGYHEEMYRIPFYIAWEGVLKPKRIKGPYSLMDIGPTLVDLVGTDVGMHNFQGRSIFDASRKDEPVFQIQPYGKHLGVVRWPYKYRYYTKNGKEFVYDLSLDAMEEKNIVGQIDETLIKTFRDDIKTIYLNQKVLEKNQILN